VSESRQRWRLVFARDEDARYLSHLDATHLWDRAFRRGEIPVATSEGFSPRPRLIFAAPLPLGMLAEHELADLYLAEKLTIAELRRRLEMGMPRGYSVVDMHDVWLGAPALATELAAADYRMTVLGIERSRLAAAAAELLAADKLPRQKRREDRPVIYDLRPLLLDLAVRESTEVVGQLAGSGAAQAAAAGLWMRLRNTQDEGSGRAEEVVSALAERVPETAAGAETVAGHSATTEADPTIVAGLEIVRPVRERLWLASELAV
jgi:radical SAM-linked protein